MPIYQAFVAYCKNFSEKLNICGISLGAIIALNYAIEFPERVQSIVLIGAQCKVPKGLMMLQNFIFKLLPKSFFAKMGLPKKNVLQLTNSMVDLDLSPRLEDILSPTLLICGGKDNANKKSANNLAQMIPNAKVSIIDNAGHVLNTEAP